MRFDEPLNDIFASGTHVKVLRALHALPTDLAVSGRDLSRRAAASHPRATRVLAELADQGVVAVQHLPRTDLYRLNRNHVLAAALAQLFVRETDLRFELLSLVAKELKRRKLPLAEARIFGSTARGSTTSGSDVDLALVTTRDSVPAVENAAQQIADAVRQRFGMRLNVLVGSPTLNVLSRARRPGRSVWQTIEREGIDVLSESVAAH